MIMSHLDPGLAEPQLLTELLPHESVRVVSLVKQPLQAIELLQTETNIIIQHHFVFFYENIPKVSSAPPLFRLLFSLQFFLFLRLLLVL